MFIFKVGRFLYKSYFVLFTYKLKAKSAVWVAEQDARTGDSGFARLGSHLERADGADAAVGQDARTGDSGFSRLGSHLARADGADAVAGQDARTGDSGFCKIGSHLAEMDAAEGRAGQVEGLGSSKYAGTGSHPAAADFSDEPEAVLWRRPPIAPYRIRPSAVRDGLAGQFGTENGPVVYARFILVSGPHAAVAAAQVRRKAGRSVAGGCGTGRPVADKCLVMSRIMICPIGFC